jgi:hypothetical protein
MVGCLLRLRKGTNIHNKNGVNDVQNLCYVQITNELAKYPCDSVTLSFYRAGEPMQARLFIGDQAKIGVFAKGLSAFYTPVHTETF